LTDRDGQAADFAHLFRLDKPRTDFPSLNPIAVAEKVTASVAEPRPEDLDAPVTLDVLPFLGALAIDVAEQVPARKPDVIRRLEEIRTVRDALDFEADMRAAPVEVVVRVHDAAGKAVPGSNVKLTFATVHEGRISDGSDGQERGTIRFKDVVPGKYLATVETPGASQLTKPVVVPPVPERKFVLDIALEGNEHISLVLFPDEGSPPLANTDFRLFLNPGAEPQQGRTDDKGALRITGVREGDFKLEAAGFTTMVPAISRAIEQLKWVLSVPDARPGNPADLLPPRIEFLKVFRFPEQALFPAGPADQRALEDEITARQLAATSSARAPAGARVVVAWQANGNLKSLTLEGVGSVLEVTASDGTGSRVVQIPPTTQSGATLTFTLRAEPAGSSQATKAVAATVVVTGPEDR
jgi:hypothetical protein